VTRLAVLETLPKPRPLATADAFTIGMMFTSAATITSYTTASSSASVLRFYFFGGAAAALSWWNKATQLPSFFVQTVEE
jgi:hypothetical protein